MKTQLLFLSAIFFSFSISAQIDFEAHITVDDTGGTNNPRAVFAADLDGDGDMDMLSVSNNDSKIAWYKNTDGQGDFGPQQIIYETGTQATAIYATDIDGDSRIDILAATDGKVVWFKNTDGQGNFSNPQEIANNILAYSVYADDVDNDGDMDVSVSASNNIGWFENLDGEGTFGAQNVIATSYESPQNALLADIDGDGDLDILSAIGYYENQVVWFKNTDGQGNFVEAQTLTTDLFYANDAVTADLDGDGDLDIVVVSKKLEGHRVIWFENTNGLGNFNNTPHVIDMENIFNPEVLYAVDFDNDNDLDITVGTSNMGIVWYKNNGNGTFGSQLPIDSNVENITSIFTTDIDGDGDEDLLLSAGTADRVAWHKNTNGQGNFGPANELADINGANGPYQVQSADIDGDGDKDIIAALYHDNRVVWQENLDGQGNFSELRELGSLNACHCRL